MNKPCENFGLSSPDGREAQLLSVQIHGELLGLMLRLTIRQTWRNVSGAPMASRFSFPLDWNQTLLSLQALRSGETLTPARIERDSRQRCSAALGLLGTGEQVSMVWRVGQLMTLEGGSLRVQLPACLAPHAPYPVQLDFEVHDPLAQGTVSSASHELHRVRHARGTTLRLKPQHALGKDLVLHVHGLREKGFAVASPDITEDGSCTVLVSGHVHLPQDATESRPLRMKLLLDGSGAMPVERLSQIHSALDRVLARLTPQDQLSLSRFGNQTVHDLPRLQACTEAYQRRLRTLARRPHSDLGTPQVEAALHEALAITDEDEETVRGAAILLVTASPLWAIEPMLHKLRAAEHTVHVLVVGEMAGQSLWSTLAKACGGMCEQLAPGQHVEPQLNRLIGHMRAQTDVQTTLQVQGAQMLALTERPSRLCDGDTLHLWARVCPDSADQDLVGCPELQATLSWQRDEVRAKPVSLTPLPVLWDETGDLARLCASRDALQLEDDREKQALRARHGLVWPDASRLEATQTVSLPRSISVPSGHVPASMGPDSDDLLSPSQPGNTATVVTAIGSRTQPAGRPIPPRHADLATWLQDKSAAGNPVSALVQGFNAQASVRSQFRPALSATLHQVPTRFLDGLVLQLSRRAGNPGRVWALMLHWLHAEHDMPLNPQALQLLEQELATLPVAVRNEVNGVLHNAAEPQANRQAA
jgi:hypothetical protein